MHVILNQLEVEFRELVLKLLPNIIQSNTMLAYDCVMTCQFQKLCFYKSNYNKCMKCLEKVWLCRSFSNVKRNEIL